MRVFEAQKQHNEEAKMFSMAPRPTESVIGVNSQWLSSPGRALERYRSFQRCLVTQGRTTLREQLTYPTWKRKIVFKKCLGRGYISSQDGSTNHLSYLSSILKP